MYRKKKEEERAKYFYFFLNSFVSLLFSTKRKYLIPREKKNIYIYPLIIFIFRIIFLKIVEIIRIPLNKNVISLRYYTQRIIDEHDLI